MSAIIDSSEKGYVLAGLPFDMDKQAAKLLEKDWMDVKHLALIADSGVKKSAPDLAPPPAENR